MDLRKFWLSVRDDDLMLQDDLKKRRAFAVQILRSGEPLTPEVRNAIADLIEPPARGRGRPSAPPGKWYEVGKLREEGVTIAQVCKELGLERDTVERGWAYYKKSKRAHDAGID